MMCCSTSCIVLSLSLLLMRGAVRAHLLVVHLPLCALLDDPVGGAALAVHDEPLVWMLLGKDVVHLRDGEDRVSTSVALDHRCVSLSLMVLRVRAPQDESVPGLVAKTLSPSPRSSWRPGSRLAGARAVPWLAACSGRQAWWRCYAGTPRQTGRTRCRSLSPRWSP